ncbi:MinD/ParA family ATP-binding protein [Ruania zhangjianzhongii]|uniref:MinD/ParA family ATP-binding protein n=1 Tax=Ruania zhangjianzhongii TaxID=2603206 RepID=UPI0011C78E9D|nr:cobalamin biosynthesis protein CobQ [Ruania zhangjianzhongii]
MTFGLASPSPDPRVVEWHADRAAVNANFPRLLTAMVANPKGGRGKTPLSLLLAAAFGELRGGGVCAWDNNETLGTMGIRTEVGPYRTTVVDLVDDLDRFEHVRARRGDLGQYTHHQAAGHFDALISDEDPTRMAMVDREQFERIHELLGRFYNIIMIDTGNNPKAANFVAALAASDVLVIPIQWTRDSVVTAGRLVDQLREAGREDLVASAVTVVSDKGQSLKASPEQVASWREWFTDTTGSIINVPFDPHIAEDGVLRWDALQEGTQRALVRVAAAISHAFSHRVSQTGVRQ